MPHKDGLRGHEEPSCLGFEKVYLDLPIIATAILAIAIPQVGYLKMHNGCSLKVSPADQDNAPPQSAAFIISPRLHREKQQGMRFQRRHRYVVSEN